MWDWPLHRELRPKLGELTFRDKKAGRNMRNTHFKLLRQQ